MPMYDYKCTKCGTLFEELVLSSTVADNQIKCPKCGTVIPKDNEEDNPFERNEAYIEHRKEFPYYPDKNKEKCPHN